MFNIKNKSMTYLDYINSIPEYQGGGSISGENPTVALLKDMTPFVGTYRAFQRAKEDPRFGTYADAGLSAIGDVATLFGVGSVIKGLSAANKARKAYKAANAAEEMYNAYDNARNFQKAVQAQEAAKIRRGNQTIESLSLMDRSPKVESEIIKRIKSRDASRQLLRDAKSAENIAAQQARINSANMYDNLRKARYYDDVIDDAQFGMMLGGLGTGVGNFVPDLPGI